MKLFGTAGIRGIANQELTPELALALGKTFGIFLGKGSKVLIGRDTRTSSEMIKNALVSGLLSTGCNVDDSGIVPIPLINFTVRKKYAGGIMVTSSHNPPQWNGVKFVMGTGLEISQAHEIRFEKIFASKEFRQVSWKEIGKYEKTEVIDAYIKKAVRSVNKNKLKKLKVAADLADGAQTALFPGLLKKIGCKHEFIHTGQTGLFSRDSEPSAKSLKKLRAIVLKKKLDLGIGFDCDGDRVVFVTPKGKVIMGDVLGTMICNYMLSKRKGLIVTPIATSSIIDEVADWHNAKIKRTPVGSKFVAKVLLQKSGLFGFEESDGFVFPNFNLTKDGSFTALKVLEILADTGKTIDQLIQELPKYHQIKKKVHCPDTKKQKVIQNLTKSLKQRHSTMDGLKIFFKGGWVLIRPSGTEPILRVYAESKDKKRAQELSVWGIKQVKKAQ